MWRDRKRESTRSPFLEDIAFYKNVPLLRQTIRNGRKKNADKSDEIQKSHDCMSALLVFGTAVLINMPWNNATWSNVQMMKLRGYISFLRYGVNCSLLP
jgi:hypothetical protein